MVGSASAPDYKDLNSTIGNFLRLLFGLSFLEPKDVEDSFVDELILIKSKGDRLDKFCDYISENYFDTNSDGIFQRDFSYEYKRQRKNFSILTYIPLVPVIMGKPGSDQSLKYNLKLWHEVLKDSALAPPRLEWYTQYMMNVPLKIITES